MAVWRTGFQPRSVTVAGGKQAPAGVTSRMPGRGRRRSKYGAVRSQGPAGDGGTRQYDSRTGARLALLLTGMQQRGEIKAWAEEVSLPIGRDEQGRMVRYRADALVVLDIVPGADGQPVMLVRLLDAKCGSHDTRLSRAKRAALRARGFPVEIVPL
jgi:hypothetical protein